MKVKEIFKTKEKGNQVVTSSITVTKHTTLKLCNEGGAGRTLFS